MPPNVFPILVDGTWRPGGAPGAFRAVDPATGEPLPGEYPISLAVCSIEFLRLRRLAEKGHKTFLDAYGANNEAEFFAVATEEFFDRPL